MSFELTKEQQLARDLTGSDLLVSAAAGSGKTAVLVERIMRMLTDPENPVSLDQMLIVTFTTAAAAQMKEKIEQKILSALEDDPDNAFLEEQFRYVSSAHIQTNHSFSLFVVKNYITRLQGLDPGFRVADDAENALLKMDVLRDTLEYWYNEALKASRSDASLSSGKDSEKAEASGDSTKEDAANFLFFADCFGGVRQDVSIEKLVLDVYDFMLSEPDPAVWLDESIRFYEKNAASDENTKNLSLPALYGLRVLLKSFMKALREEKERRNLISIEDFEHLCLELLSDEAVCSDLRDQFAYIFVDEYQDCNRIQEAILQKIARRDENGHSRNLFMVGDVKQSIYGFRHADPSLFLSKYQSFSKDPSSGPCKVLLKKNFRSGKDVIDTVNYFFSSLMTSEVGGLAYGPDEALVQGLEGDSSTEDKGPHAAFVLLQTDKKIQSEDMIRLEANETARIIQKEIINGKDPSEIVILLRSVKQTAGIYVDALKKLGIEAISDSSENFYETFEIRMVLNLLRVVDNPRQDIPLAGVLLSFIGGFSENELATIRLGNQDGLLFDAVSAFAQNAASSDLKEKVDRFLNMLQHLREKSRLFGVHDFLWDVYMSTGLYLFVSSMPGGKTRAANLDLLLSKSAAFEEGTYHGLYQFIRYIDQMEKDRQTEAEAKVIEEGAHAVSVISIHKSKGLEYPVVLVCGLGRKRNEMSLREKLLLHDSLGIGLDPVDPEKGVSYESPVKNMIRDRLKSEQIAEEIRLLYVAMTRAKETLYLIGSETLSDEKDEEKPSAGKVLTKEEILSCSTSLEWLKLIAERKTENRPFTISYRTCSEADLTEEDRSPSASLKASDGKDAASSGFDDSLAPSELSENEKLQISYQYPYARLGYLPQLVSVSQLKREHMQEDLEATDEMAITTVDLGLEEPESRSKTGLSGSERGTLFHTIAALAPIEDLKNKAYQKILDELVQHGKVSRESLAYLPDSWLEGWAKSRLFARMAASPSVFREEAFIMAMTPSQIRQFSSRFDLSGSDDSETIMVQGIIDCFFQEGDGYVLLDYKTDKILDEPKLQGYRTQLNLYEMAIERSTGKKIKEKYIYDVVRHREIPC